MALRTVKKNKKKNSSLKIDRNVLKFKILRNTYIYIDRYLHMRKNIHGKRVE